MPIHLPKIYPITDVGLAGMSHAEQVRQLILGGATFIQVREKKMPPAAFYDEARQALVIARSSGAKLIINDRVDVALAVSADGVHLGQDDSAPENARKILGDDRIIGFSTHSVEQAIAAARLPIDYLAIGPIFGTTTKQNPSPTVGLEGLSAVRAAVPDIPIVAIGGITGSTIADVLSAGADSVALISAVLSSAVDIATRTRDLLKLSENPTVQQN